MKEPGPDHPIHIEAFAGRVRIAAGGRVLGESAAALVMREADYPPVYYVPRADIDMSALSKTGTTTHCPYKGDAGYFSISGADGEDIENAVWTYERPYPAMAAIAGHLAFYPNKVELTATPD